MAALTIAEITEENLDIVVALKLAPGQERFVAPVAARGAGRAPRRQSEGLTFLGPAPAAAGEQPTIEFPDRED